MIRALYRWFPPIKPNGVTAGTTRARTTPIAVPRAGRFPTRGSAVGPVSGSGLPCSGAPCLPPRCHRTEPTDRDLTGEASIGT
jgi:hypothetical protein